MNQGRIVLQRRALSNTTGSSSHGATSRRRRVEAIQQFFVMMEEKFGGNIKSLMDTGPQAEVIESQSFLRTDDLKRLMNHDATAIHVKQFYDPQIAKELGQRIAKKALTHANNWRIGSNNSNNSSNDVSRGMESSDVSTMGEFLPFNVVSCNTPHDNDSSIDAYFEGVQREFQKRKKHYDKAIWPLDQLRLELDEMWPGGAGLARETKSKRPFGAGLPRIMMGPTRWKQDGYIHVDEMAPLSSQQGLFSANIYLQLPHDQSGNHEQDFIETKSNAGDFAIWPLGIRSRWDWYKNAVLLSGLSTQNPESQIRLRKELGEPHRIKLESGDLVLLSVQRPHSAIGFDSGTRISLQCFIQHNGIDSRLLIDS